MLKRILKFCTVPFIVVAVVYVLFLILPVFLSPILNMQSQRICDAIKESTGFEPKLEKLSLVTTWDFAVGVKAGNLELTLPKEKSPFLSVENIGVSLSVFPIFAGKIQLDSLFADDVYAELTVKEDGTLLLMDSLPKTKNPSPKTFDLPFGFKLSNHLPDVRVKSYLLAMNDRRTSRLYSMQGENFKITNFVFDKRIKIASKGNIKFGDDVISNFDIKIDNKIMPKLQIHDLVFPKDVVVDESPVPETNENISFTPILDILNLVYKNGFTANVFTDVDISGSVKEPKLHGQVVVDNLSVLVFGKRLKDGYVKLISKGSKTELDSVFYSSYDAAEKTELEGIFKFGKKKLIDLSFKSNAKFQNFINFINSIAMSFGVNDYKTLSATGGVDADFNLKTDFKTNVSSGYLKVLPSTLNYGLYNLQIKDILADVSFDNNIINIKDLGFSIFGQPLRLKGTVEGDTTTDLRLTADKLSLKGLLLATGQLTMLKENNVNSGTVSLLATLKGKFKEIEPKFLASIDNVNLYNIPSKLKFTLGNAVFKLLYDGKSASGKFDINSANLLMQGAKISVPKANIGVDENNIKISDSYLLLNNSRVDLKGVISDYLNDKLLISVSADGNIQSRDIVAFLPKDFVNLISYKGALPLRVDISGNKRVQKINAQITANPSNYVSLIDLKSLKGKSARIHSSMELLGDSLTFSNTGVSSDKGSIAILSGDITKLYSSPKLNLNIYVPVIESFPIWGMGNSNISANGNVSVSGDAINPKLRGTVNITDLSIKDMDFSISDIVADLNGSILNGSASAKQFKFGGIVATDVTGKISLDNYSKFYFTEASAKCFDGKVTGKLAYDIPTFSFATEFKGSGLNSTKAIEGAVGIKNALTGTMGFDGKLTGKGVTDKEIINSLKGHLNFDVSDGRFVGIGKLENLVAAQNVKSNAILKSAISALSGLATVQETDRFKYIMGEMKFSGGVAELSRILVSGPLMSYYVKGTYSIIPNSAILTILGRLDEKVISCLGPLGQLSADKLLAYIPKFGPATASVLKQLSSDPANEKLELIPELSSGSKSYKDFKVSYNGSVENPSSVRSFKWLSSCDTSQLDIKQDLENAVKNVQTNITTTVENTQKAVQNAKTNIDNAINVQKNKIEDAKKEFEQTKTDIQNLKQNSQQSSENLKKLFINAVKNSSKQMNSGTTQQDSSTQTEETTSETSE